MPLFESPLNCNLFYRLWTLKEALVKGAGHRVRPPTPPGSRRLPAMRRGAMAGVFSFPHLPSVAWRLEDIGDERFAAALAHELESP